MSIAIAIAISIAIAMAIAIAIAISIAISIAIAIAIAIAIVWGYFLNQSTTVLNQSTMIYSMVFIIPRPPITAYMHMVSFRLGIWFNNLPVRQVST